MNEYQFKVKGTKNIYDLRLVQQEDGHIKSASCSCKGHSITGKPCKHILALFVNDRDVILEEEASIELLMDKFKFDKFTEIWEF